MNDYISRLLKSDSVLDVMPFFAPHKRACKEITESWACLEAAKGINVPLDHRTAVAVIGDGVIPRTGALFAFFTKCSPIYSIDPQLTMDGSCFPDRLFCIPNKVENLRLPLVNAKYKRILLVLPHSHAPIKDAVRLAAESQCSRIDIVCMPCCTDDYKGFLTKSNPPKTYIDKKVLSPKNQVYVWENYPA